MEIDFRSSLCYIFKKTIFFEPMRKPKTFLNLKLGKRRTRRPKPGAFPLKKASKKKF